MELAGLIIRALPGHLQRVKSNLLGISGLEIHHTDPDGRLIVTLEHDTSQALANSISQLQVLDHVLAVSLVYQHSEELDDTSEVSSDQPQQSPLESPDQWPLEPHLQSPRQQIELESYSSSEYAQCSPEQEKSK